ncbi:uncharacterized protein BDR25DRAFT_373111 [Lindgomyces ingoldianus]|uniref:Uncharacterized protein n=1 Tax=Lindgomyces ingoldianus TaxID=673940 RepID=A0ACB6QPN6_9PLEO|nr:uncharacterized protein BDR25DRAFT_373111 [Lindgomyces ingoldianus]KAF2468533.1 hypothetical protein BDR25DRAFT_373111 [Lindgomyces ingoldianus]
MRVALMVAEGKPRGAVHEKSPGTEGWSARLQSQGGILELVERQCPGNRTKVSYASSGGGPVETHSMISKGRGHMQALKRSSAKAHAIIAQRRGCTGVTSLKEGIGMEMKPTINMNLNNYIAARQSFRLPCRLQGLSHGCIRMPECLAASLPGCLRTKKPSPVSPCYFEVLGLGLRKAYERPQAREEKSRIVRERSSCGVPVGLKTKTVAKGNVMRAEVVETILV